MTDAPGAPRDPRDIAPTGPAMGAPAGGVGRVDADLEAFWIDARLHAGIDEMSTYMGQHPLAAVRPPAWSFGASPEQADRLLALVLDGAKTATAGALWDYEAAGEPLPSEGQVSIVLDGQGRPRALVRTDDVTVVPFDQVDEAHAHAEGEGDRSLAQWREVHRRFFTEEATHGRGFHADMPVVLERFSVLYAPSTESGRPEGASSMRRGLVGRRSMVDTRPRHPGEDGGPGRD